ncbi:MAG: hypothetical protein N2Z74_10330, partial [Syntrophales bacterium]|nr:hypothetical protein [Syntrophales bacterium]
MGGVFFTSFALHGEQIPTLPPPFSVVVTQPTLIWELEFPTTTDPAVWQRLLDHPTLFGVLWNAYGFQPVYRITEKDGRIH